MSRSFHTSHDCECPAVALCLISQHPNTPANEDRGMPWLHQLAEHWELFNRFYSSSLYTQISLQITSQTKWRSRVRNVLQAIYIAASNSFERTPQEANKLPHKEAHHAALPLTCPLCERETSQTVFINKTTGGLVCPPCKVHGELVRLGEPSA